ncbi:MAG: DNA adenine methylase [Armatimonadetes bacterium]|nr:DNA adenine methylase [Armatimonadota bacterium]
MDNGSAEFVYDRADHAAAWTDSYVFHQLIPYIGNKRKLLGLIKQAISQTSVMPPATFLDLFAGSGVVSRMAKQMGFHVLANDWEPYAQTINGCYIGNNTPLPFTELGGYENAIATLNRLPPREDWITRHLCPASDDHYDIRRDRLFYTRANGMKMDAMRSQIELWRDQGHIDAEEEACLLAPLLYQACYVSNTSGVFKGFHNGWGGQTGTALYRILSQLTLSPAVFHDNGQANAVSRQDALALARQLRDQRAAIDIAYLDPPYNQHPYASNYHVLNTLTLWDHPILTEKIQGRNKAAIREDWRTGRRSAYNYRGEAERAYVALMQALDARFILTSYSTDGMIALPKLLEICLRRGHTEYVLQVYKRYRVSTQRFSVKPVNVEFVLIVDTTRPHTGPDASELTQRILLAEADAVSRAARRGQPCRAAPTPVDLSPKQ